ncbi:transmembrane protein 134 isoform X2 [Nerophis lumbriciformis]|uniref:transmembrane protein 134 isoform X2 n=1 Tax=Nerophis lumbriciformis TaxID=546530 RepID=UPI002ADFC8D4|nr:transmembrane protein 134-like isoform X2 [Nerophis lumbriciformis]
MATQFTIDDAFVLDGEEEGDVSQVDPADWRGRDKDRDGEMTFGPLTFSKTHPHPHPHPHPSPAMSASPEHSNLKYQNLENEDPLGSSGNSSFNNFFKISESSTLSYCSSQWSFSTLSSVTHLSAHWWVSHPLVKKNRKVVLASFLLLITGVALIFTGVVIQLSPNAGVSSAIFFVPGFLLFIPGVYHVIYISCAVRGRRGFKLFYLPYFEK